jgi:hypothetical protein
MRKKERRCSQRGKERVVCPALLRVILPSFDQSLACHVQEFRPSRNPVESHQSLVSNHDLSGTGGNNRLEAGVLAKRSQGGWVVLVTPKE